jgi:thymidylate kinase
VALEGPCCAGKTTLGLALVQNAHGLTIAFARCYADHAGGGRYLPPQDARSVTERENALRELLAVEASRLAGLPPGAEVILLDRSVHTLIANSYALEQMTGIGFSGPSEQLLRRSPIPAWPDLIMYLDLPQPAVDGRNNGKFPRDSIYIDARFNAAIRAYFLRLASRKSPRVAWLDATLDPAELAQRARALLMRASRCHSQGVT